MQNNGFYTNKTLNIKGRLISLNSPKVMGILNVTPDSFYDGGRFKGDQAVLAQAERLIREGAQFIDVGGCSTRPGAPSIDEAVELERILPVVRVLTRHFPDTPLSIDTFRSHVARKAVDEGVTIINDISGGEMDPAMFETVAALGVPYILMHMKGTPETMKQLTHYDNLLKDVIDYFQKKIYTLRQLGVKDIILDPGFGFAKTADQNFELLQHLDSFKIFGIPILAGLSRKSLIWKTLDTDPSGALNGTTALNTIALTKGARLLRVHDVKEAIECITLYEKTQAHKLPVQ